MQHFVACMGSSPPETAAADALVRQLAELTPSVPFYAASVFRAWVSQMNERLVADLAAARNQEDAPVSGGEIGQAAVHMSTAQRREWQNWRGVWAELRAALLPCRDPGLRAVIHGETES